MRLLLDTNIVIPLLNETVADLPAGIRSALSLADAVFLLSVASIWEIGIKTATGRLQLVVRTDQLAGRMHEMGVAVLPITPAHVVAPVDPMPDTRDPFDRLLLGICRVEGMRLVTTDAKLARHPLAWTPPSA